MLRDAEIQVARAGKAERYEVRGLAGEYPYLIHADLAKDSEQVELPPPPPEVWLVYKHNGAYADGGPLQGIYSSEEGAKDSVRFSVKRERASLRQRLGFIMTPHHEEEPELKWQLVHHQRYGPIPGEYYTEAGLANFVVKSYKVPEGYLMDTKWCVVPHTTEADA